MGCVDKHKIPGDAPIRTIRRVTWVGFWVNAALMMLKVAIGLYGHSDALVADGIHSLSDFATDLIVLVFVGIAYKGADAGHPYGHGKFETFASLLIGVVLLGVAVGLGVGGVKAIASALDGETLPRPDVWTIVVAVAAIASKEWLYRYTVNAGRRVDSSALVANAAHHRSDAVSSVATLVGVSAAYFLGEQWRILDPIAAILIAVFIAISAVQIAAPSINELLERSLPSDEVGKVEQVIATTPGVRGCHRLRTRRNGHSYIFDMHILVDPDITVTQGHNIATEVEERLRALYGQDIIASVHVEPYHERQAIS